MELKTTFRTAAAALLFGILAGFGPDALAQKAKANKPTPIAKPAPAAKAAPSMANTAAEGREPQDLPGTYFLMVEESPASQTTLDMVRKYNPELALNPTESPLLWAISGEPARLYRAKLAFPELTWLRPDQLLLLSKYLSKMPELSNPEYLEKMGGKN